MFKNIIKADFGIGLPIGKSNFVLYANLGL